MSESARFEDQPILEDNEPEQIDSTTLDTESDKKDVSQSNEAPDDSVNIPLISSKGECNIPSYFIDSEETVKRCNDGMAGTLFKAALFINLSFCVLFFKNITTPFLIGFFIFHLFLYYFIHSVLVSISVGEWRTFQAYKAAVRNDPELSRFDTPLTMFKSVTSFLQEQPINKPKMIYMIIVVSFIFVWLPVIFNIGGEARFEISEIRKALPLPI